MKKTKKSKYLISILIMLMVGIITVFATTFSGCSFPIKPLQQTLGSQSNKSVSGYVNNYSFYDLNKNKISFSDYAGKILVLNFWATWCPPCRAEIPEFAETYAEYKDKGVQFLGISDDDVNSLNNYYKTNNINYPTLIDGSIDKIMPSWRIDAIPHTFILNGKGEIIFDQLGQMAREDLVNAIKNALQKQG